MLIEPQLFPNLDFYKIALRNGNLMLEVFENFQKQSFRNRYNIAGPNGIQSLVVPIKKYGVHNCPIMDVGISYETDWQKIHWRTLETAYNSSPYFLYYQDELQELIFTPHQNLIDFSIKSIEFLNDNLNLEIKITKTKSFENSQVEDADFRNLIHPKKPPLEAHQEYHQVYQEKNGFINNLSALDILFNEGPAAEALIRI